MTAIPFGLGSTGFVAKTADEAQAEIQSDFQAAFGASIDVSPQSALGQLAGIMGQRFGALWNVGQAVYASQDPATASDVGLDGVCAITGTIRDNARPSTSMVTCIGTSFTSLAAGRVVSVVGTGIKFTTDADALIVNAPSMNALTAYAVGTILYLSGAIVIVTVAGITDSILNPFPGPSTASPGDQGTMTGGSPVTVMLLGAGRGYANVPVTAQQSGPFLALAGTLTVIETPVAGWNGVWNLLDALVGANLEGDPALRIRREVELEGDADAAPNAIRAKVLKVGENTDNPVTACTVFQNTTMTVDANGLPPKSVEVLVQGGVDADILQTVFDTVAGGIETVGNQSGNVTDDGENIQLVKFSRANLLLVYVTFNLEVDPALFPVTGGITLGALVSLITYAIGKGVAASALIPTAFQIPGVVNCPLPFIGLAASPSTSTTIIAGSHDRAMFDSSRVIVNVTNTSEGNP